MSDTVREAREYSEMELLERHEHLSKTIELIDKNLQSDELYEQDKPEIERNRQLFEEERAHVERLLGSEAVQAA